MSVLSIVGGLALMFVAYHDPLRCRRRVLECSLSPLGCSASLGTSVLQNSKTHTIYSILFSRLQLLEVYYHQFKQVSKRAATSIECLLSSLDTRAVLRRGADLKGLSIRVRTFQQDSLFHS